MVGWNALTRPEGRAYRRCAAGPAEAGRIQTDRDRLIWMHSDRRTSIALAEYRQWHPIGMLSHRSRVSRAGERSRLVAEWCWAGKAEPAIPPAGARRAATLRLSALKRLPRKPREAPEPGGQRTAAATLTAVPLSASSSLMLVIITSVVSMSAATLAAFCRAVRTTLVGSMMPALSRSTIWPVPAL